jgi:hypothetical protein
VKTDDAGRFNFPLLKPGPYVVKTEADQFEARESETVLAGLGQKQTVNFTLKTAVVNQNIEEQPLIGMIKRTNPSVVVERPVAFSTLPPASAARAPAQASIADLPDLITHPSISIDPGHHQRFVFTESSINTPPTRLR